MDDVRDVTCDICPSNLRWAILTTFESQHCRAIGTCNTTCSIRGACTICLSENIRKDLYEHSAELGALVITSHFSFCLMSSALDTSS